MTLKQAKLEVKAVGPELTIKTLGVLTMANELKQVAPEAKQEIKSSTKFGNFSKRIRRFRPIPKGKQVR